MKHCTYCGAELANDALVCASCDQPVVSEEAPIEKLPFEEEIPMEQPRKKRKRWPWIACSIALLLAVLAAFYFLVLRKEEAPNPKETVTAAVNATVEDLKTVFAKTENLQTLLKKSNTLSTEQFCYDLSLEVTTLNTALDVVTVTLKGEGNADINADVLTSGSLEFFLRIGDDELPILLEYSVDNEQIMLRLPDYICDAYSVSLDDLADALDMDFSELDTFDSLKPSKRAENQAKLTQIKEKLKLLWEGAAVVLEGEKEYDLRLNGAADAKNTMCQVYTLSYDQALYAQLIDLLFGEEFQEFAEEWNDSQEIMEQLEEISKVLRGETVEAVHVIVCNKKAIGVEVHAKADEKPFTLNLWLKGEENPWNHIELVSSYDGEETVNVLTLAATQDGFTLGLEAKESSLKFDYTDTTPTLVMQKDNEFESTEYTITLSQWQDGVSVGLLTDIDGTELSLTISQAPMAEAPQRLSEEAQDLLSMSEDELQKLLMKIVLKLTTDPETSWITDYIGSTTSE